MIRSHVIQLRPNNKQRTYFAKAVGTQRFIYNWGLSAWKKVYETGEEPNGNSLKKRFNAIKRQEFPWVVEVTKCVVDAAFNHLNQAFRNFFRKKTGKAYPKFHKKGIHESFTVDNTKFVVDDKKIRIPKLGWVRMAEKLRFQGKIMSATIRKRANKWFASISVQMPDSTVSENQVTEAVGIDLGIKTLATFSDGTVFENPKTYYKHEKQLRRVHKSLSRKRKGSNNWKKAKLKLARLYYRLGCIVDDHLHKMTRYIANNYAVVCLEDLNVKGLLKNRHLSKAVSRANFCKVKWFLSYKCREVRLIDRFFPSSKMCSNCGKVQDMPLEKRTYVCSCGLRLDRDLNAAINILRAGCPEVKPVETEALACSNTSETTVCEAGNQHQVLMGVKGVPSNFV